MLEPFSQHAPRVQGSDGLFSGSDGGAWSDGGEKNDEEEGGVDFSAVQRAYQPDADDTKSRFTEYSMTSSILPRSEKLQLHDDRFEEFYSQCVVLTRQYYFDAGILPAGRSD